jgi:hemoglobin-like flavoprotein
LDRNYVDCQILEKTAICSLSLENLPGFDFFIQKRIMSEEALRPLTEEQIKLLRQTLKAMDTDRLAMRFYTSLFVKHPEVKSLFPDDLTELSTKIVSVFQLVVHSFELNPDGNYYLQKEVLRPLRALGELHEKKGVDNRYYTWVNELLLESMHAELPGKFSKESEVAWKLALNHLTFAMLSEIKIPAGELPSSMRESYNQIQALLFRL